MKHVELSSHVRKGLFTKWLVRIGVVCAAAAFLLSPLSTQASTMVTQGEFLGWLGAAIMIGGLAVECAALICTKSYSLARCLPWQVVGFVLFCVGAVILIAAKSF